MWSPAHSDPRLALTPHFCQGRAWHEDEAVTADGTQSYTPCSTTLRTTSIARLVLCTPTQQSAHKNAALRGPQQAVPWPELYQW